MFISKDQAEARLKRSDNLLREQEVIVEYPANHPVEGQDVEILDAPASTPRADNSEFDALLKGVDKLDHMVGRYRGNRPAQKAIADISVILGPETAGAIAGLSPEQSRAYMMGKTTGAGASTSPTIPEVKSHVDMTKERIRALTATKLEKTLNHLTDDKFNDEMSAGDVGRLAKDLATVHDKMEKKDAGSDNGVHFHVFVPEIKKITNYNIIRVTTEKPEEAIP